MYVRNVVTSEGFTTFSAFEMEGNERSEHRYVVGSVGGEEAES